VIDAGGLVVQHHVFHLHNDGAVAVIRRVLERLIRLLVVVQFHNVQQTIAEVARQGRQGAPRVPGREKRSIHRDGLLAGASRRARQGRHDYQSPALLGTPRNGGLSAVPQRGDVKCDLPQSKNLITLAGNRETHRQNSDRRPASLLKRASIFSERSL